MDIEKLEKKLGRKITNSDEPLESLITCTEKPKEEIKPEKTVTKKKLKKK